MRIAEEIIRINPLPKVMKNRNLLIAREKLVSTLTSLGLEAVYEQGSHGKGNSDPHHTCPPVMLPRQTRNECTGRTTQKVNGHINGIDTIDSRCVKGDYAGLIRQIISKIAIIIHK